MSERLRGINPRSGSDGDVGRPPQERVRTCLLPEDTRRLSAIDESL